VNVVLFSDLAHTGFGRVGRELAAGLLNRGHAIRIIGINWRGFDGELVAAMDLNRDGIPEQVARGRAFLDEAERDPLLPFQIAAQAGGDGMGHNLTRPALTGVGMWPGFIPDAAIVVADPRAMWLRLGRDEGSVGAFIQSGKRVYNYVPVEGGGLPHDWTAIYAHVTPVTMSLFGQAQMEQLLQRPVDLAPHGVSSAFRPITAQDPAMWKGQTVTSREGAKAALDLAGKTVVVRADRFIFRKNYPAFFRIMEPLLADPNLVVLVHTTPYDDDGRGTIWQLISRLPGARATGISRTGEAMWEHPQVLLTGAHDSFRGLTDEGLRVLFSAADLMVSPTMAEGFGLCLAESLACGTPVVATDYSAVPEVVGPGGVLVPVRSHITNAYAHEWALVDEEQMTAAVARLLAKPAERASLGLLGRMYVRKYTWSAAVDVFDRLIS
jgi:glycosyltransferase involved in cell wall biosynthesis